MAAEAELQSKMNALAIHAHYCHKIASKRKAIANKRKVTANKRKVKALLAKADLETDQGRCAHKMLHEARALVALDPFDPANYKVRQLLDEILDLRG